MFYIEKLEKYTVGYVDGSIKMVQNHMIYCWPSFTFDFPWEKSQLKNG
jgi:hypothetical protein